MRTLSRHAVVLAVLASGLGLGAIDAANASWQGCPETHVAYNPVTGGAIKVGVAQQIGQAADRPVWAWACVDDGGLLGANSAGTASYVNNYGYDSFLEHTVVCAGTAPCTQTYVGAAAYPPDAGTVGAKPCVSPVVAQDLVCASVGVTPGSVPVTLSGPDSCVANIASNCVGVPKVQTGGTVATVYVGGSSVPVNAPAVCVAVRATAPFVSVQPGSGC